jgi:predicted aldo/keto reductase-like oxidoreductase
VLAEEDRVRLVRSAYDRGIRYFDTAPVYYESESIIGRALADVRDDVYLATKVEATAPEDVRPMVETSLKRLRTDTLDCVQIHGLPGIENMTVSEAMRIHAELVKLRDEGLFSHIGLTGHTAFDKMYRMISSGGFDTVLLGHGYVRKGWDTLLSHPMVEQREMCLAKAHELGMGIIAMKALGGWLLGHDAATYAPDADAADLTELPAAAIRYVLQEDRFHLLLIGMCVPSDLEQAVATVSGDWTLTNRDRQRLAEFAARIYAHPAIKGYRIT